MTHTLKTWPAAFGALLSGAKTYEIRKDDRGGYAVGDHLILSEYDPEAGEYTGGVVLVRVTHKTSGGEWGLPEGLCVLGIVRVMR